MNKRISQAKFYKQYSVLPTALMKVAEDIKNSDLSPSLIHLIETRASQINGCGFCLDMHNDEARKAGEDQQRLDVLSAWREVPWFDAAERAALDWCETLTLVSQGHATDAQFEEMSKHFSEEKIVAITAAIITINSWNRVVAAMHFIPKRRSK